MKKILSALLGKKAGGDVILGVTALLLMTLLLMISALAETAGTRRG